MSTRYLTTLGLDADDTLWQNQQFFDFTEEQFQALLSDYAEGDHIKERLLEAERQNLQHYGFGIKGFTLSMIETAIEITEGNVPATIIEEILNIGRDMLSHPVETLPHVPEMLEKLAHDYVLVLITKGDLFDQERKLAQSGLGEFFKAVEIVSDKNASTYRRIFRETGSGPERAAMAGNSLKSDVVPAIAAGSFGIYIPHARTWALEHVEKPQQAPRFHEVNGIADLPDLLARLEE